MTLQTFGKERSQRYNVALNRCLYARMNELIPLLFLLYREDWQDCTLIDMASGTGYLANLLKPLVKRVVRVDKSPEMMALAHEDADIFYADLREVSSTLAGNVQAEIITCLAALHHIYEMQDGCVEPLLSQRIQSQVIEECAKLLAPGGKLLFVDVCVPELLPGEEGEALALQMRQYYQRKQDDFQQRHFCVDAALWSALAKNTPGYFMNEQVLKYLLDLTPHASLAHILEHQQLSGLAKREQMLVVDFFDEVVAKHSMEGHVAYFPHEKNLKLTMERCGLHNVFIACLPTPWKFKSEAEAVWFVRELFALGEQGMSEPNELVQRPVEYQHIKEYIEHYLGMHTIDGITSINWQLMFIYGER